MLHNLLEVVPQIGRVQWIGIAAEAKGEIISLDEVTVLTGHGLEGDHHAKRKPDTKRQVTLIQAEHLPVVESLCACQKVRPELLRRNLVVAGINLLSLKKRLFRIGDVLLEATGPCEPCSRMERNLGTGGYQAMRGHGGITAKVLKGGMIRIGDKVCVELSQ